MLRILSVTCLLLSSVAAMASSKTDEFRNARMQVFSVPFGSLAMDNWSYRNHRKLMQLIEGSWISLEDGDLSDDAEIAAKCNKDSLTFAKISDFSFSRTRTHPETELEGKIKDVYIYRSGISYNIRVDIENTIAFYDDHFKKEAQNSKREDFTIYEEMLLKKANRQSTIMMLSSNVFVEVNSDTGYPMLFGRCL
jgi:hypothetical protein